MNDAHPRHGGYGHICHEGCEVWKRTEPSQEAVELAEKRKKAREALWCLRLEVVASIADDVAAHVEAAFTAEDSTLRAVEQRTLERAAEVVRRSSFDDDHEGTIEGKMQRAIMALGEPREAPKAEEPKR